MGCFNANVGRSSNARGSVVATLILLSCLFLCLDVRKLLSISEERLIASVYSHYSAQPKPESAASLPRAPDGRGNDVAICFLTRVASTSLADWVREIDRESLLSGFPIDVYILEDTPPESDRRTAPAGRVQYLHVATSLVAAANFTHMNTALAKGGQPMAWEKAMYLFTFDSELSARHRFVWFVEQDVFIPSVQSLVELSRQAVRYDFVSPPTEVYNQTTSWRPWRNLKRLGYPKPWRRGMVCMVGMSPLLLRTVREFSSVWSRLIFLEELLPTLAVHGKDITVWEPPALNYITWRARKGSWSLDDIVAVARQCNGSSTVPMFHPVKDESRHSLYRSSVASAWTS